MGSEFSVGPYPRETRVFANLDLVSYHILSYIWFYDFFGLTDPSSGNSSCSIPDKKVYEMEKGRAEV
jgi:hypothetical protein